MTATTNYLGLSAFRQLALGTGNWRGTFQTAMDNLEDRLALFATKSPDGHKIANFIGMHCVDYVNKDSYVAMAVGTATQTGKYYKLLTASKALLASHLTAATNNWTKAQRGTPLTSTGVATYTPDMSSRNNFDITLSVNITLANPTNAAAGQSGVFVFRQPAAGGKTLTRGSVYKSATGGTITLSTQGNAIDLLSYYSISATHYHVALAKRSS